MDNPGQAIMRRAYARAFTEWERRYREEPEKFMADAERLSYGVVGMGQFQADYFAEIMANLPYAETPA